MGTNGLEATDRVGKVKSIEFVDKKKSIKYHKLYPLNLTPSVDSVTVQTHRSLPKIGGDCKNNLNKLIFCESNFRGNVYKIMPSF